MLVYIFPAFFSETYFKWITLQLVVCPFTSNCGYICFSDIEMPNLEPGQMEVGLFSGARGFHCQPGPLRQDPSP